MNFKTHLDKLIDVSDVWAYVVAFYVPSNVQL